MGIPVNVIPQGFSQATAAMQHTLSKAIGGGRRSTGRRRKRKASAKRSRASSSGRRTRRASKRKPARLVKGSKAARAYMAKIRRKRRA